MKEKERESYNDQPYSFYLSSDEPIFIVNKAGKIIDSNDAFCKNIGYSKNEIKGVPLQDSIFLTPDSRKKAMYRQIAKLVGKQAPFYILNVQTKKGNIVSFEIETKLYSKDGEIAGEIGIVKNISKSKKKEEKELKSIQKDTLELSRQLDSKNQDIRKIQADLENKEEQIRLLEQELRSHHSDKERGKDELKKLKTDKENTVRELDGRNSKINQLSYELEQKQNR